MKKQSFYKNTYLPLAVSLMAMLFLMAGCGGDDNDNPAKPSARLKVNQTAVNFGTVKTGTTEKRVLVIMNESDSDAEVQIEISGNNAGLFSAASENFTINAGKSHNLDISFTPQAEGQFSAALKVNDIELTLNGTAAEHLSLIIEPNPLDFDIIKEGASKEQDLTIQNKTSEVITVDGTISGSDASAFSVVNKPATIGANSNATITIEFSASAKKNYSAEMTIDSEGKYKVQLVGRAGKALEFSPASLDFGAVTVGNKKILSLVLENISKSPVSVRDIAIGKNDDNAFAISATPKASELQPGAFDTVKIRFSPEAVESYTAELYLDKEKSIIVPISGDGSTLFEVTPNEDYDFGEVMTGETEEYTIKVKNISSDEIDIEVKFGSSMHPGFNLKEDPSGKLAAGATADVIVEFSPNQEKSYEENLIIESDNTSMTIKVSGSGKKSAQAAQEITAPNVGSGPQIDGTVDGVWSQADWLELELKQLETTITDNTTYNARIKSVHDGQHIYFLVEVEDGTPHEMPNRFEFLGGDPSDDQNWKLNNNGQDGLSFVFNMGGAVDIADRPFSEVGCFVSCHASKSAGNYEGGFYPTKGKTDVWYWKAGTTNPQGMAEDYYAEGPDGDKPNQRNRDKTGSAFADPNFPPTGVKILPYNVPGSDNNGLDKYKFIWASTANSFDTNEINPITGQDWAAGDALAGWVVKEPTNPFYEPVYAKGRHDGTKWIIEFKRLLDTESSNNDDIVFSTGTEVPFSFAYHNDSRKWAKFEWQNFQKMPRPSHYGSSRKVIILKIQ
ncbi:MAG: choice-of-anchor D domain-containing protein [Candidatus Kapaibacterium sp.]